MMAELRGGRCLLTELHMSESALIAGHGPLASPALVYR